MGTIFGPVSSSHNTSMCSRVFFQSVKGNTPYLGCPGSKQKDGVDHKLQLWTSNRLKKKPNSWRHTSQCPSLYRVWTSVMYSLVAKWEHNEEVNPKARNFLLVYALAEQFLLDLIGAIFGSVSSHYNPSMAAVHPLCTIKSSREGSTVWLPSESRCIAFLKTEEVCTSQETEIHTHRLKNSLTHSHTHTHTYTHKVTAAGIGEGGNSVISV